MALITNFSSASREQRWVDQVSKKFIREITIDISDENPICVFIVPNSITIFKPEAYIPQVIALGPYHHLNPNLYHMERYKIASAKSILNRSRKVKIRSLLINRLKELDPVIRGCYHSYLDLDDDTLSWIMAIDGMFLINLFQDYYIDDLEGKKMAPDAILSRDLMLLENQIPFVVLKEIAKTLRYNSSKENDIDGADDNNDQLLIMMERFCRVNSPFKITSLSSRSYHATSHLHLLGLMYHLIVNASYSESGGVPIDEEKVDESSEEIEIVEDDMNSMYDNISEITKVGMNFGIGRKILKPVQVIQDIPWDKIWNILGLKTGTDHIKHEGPKVEEIKIPSVSSLHYYAGITFRPISGGIMDTRFVQKEATLYLPVIMLDTNSEVLLRNLVAYEMAMNYSHSSPISFSQFVDLLSGIIDKSEDARVLKEHGIIKGEVTNERIAELFNGINKVTTNSSNKIAAQINNYYKKRLGVKIFKFMKKRLFSLLKVVTRLSTVLLLLLLVLYSFCEFYGCPKLFGSSS